MNKDTKIVWKPIDDLIPYEHNAKEHNETQIDNLAVSFKKYGWQNVVLIDENNVIVYGHGRCLGAKKAGLTEAPTILCTDLIEQERREYRILDNKLTESAWIDEELEFELPELDFSDFDLEFDVAKVIEQEERKKGEVPFTEILDEENNYLILKFNNSIDWLQVETLCGLKPVKAYSTRKDGKIMDSMQRVGIGRVIDGADFFNKIGVDI